MANTHYLKTSINFNSREIDIEIRGIYTPYREATYMDPPEGDEMELTEIVTRIVTREDHVATYFKEVDITELFTQEEIEEFNDQLYANGEEVV